MPINDMTSSSQDEIWYNHSHTVALRKELAIQKELVFETWKNGSEVETSNNKSLLTSYRVLEEIEQFLGYLSKGVDLNNLVEEEVEDETESSD